MAVPCGCKAYKLRIRDGGEKIQWCSLHAAAEEMLSACKKAENYIANTEGSLAITLDSGDMLRAVIAKAEGRLDSGNMLRAVIAKAEGR